jgi:formylglycine-generating enzyme required for sulfatase activity
MKEPPTDATQPMDAQMLAMIMGTPGKAPEPRPAEPPRAAPPPAEPPRAEPPRAPAPPAESPGVAAPRVPAAAGSLPADTLAMPAPRFDEKPRMTPMWLVLLALAGLMTGAVGGYFVLRALRQPEAGAGTRGGASSAVPLGTCPEGMILVPAGEFLMGSAPNDPMKGFDERPLTSQQVASFCVDIHEYPNKTGGLPRVQVTWAEARDACVSEGKRLCTEAEWEKACKGPDSSRFPYGENYDVESCNTEDASGTDRTVAPAGRHDWCRSDYGVMDLSGNVAEWTATRYADHADMTQKGGSFDRPGYAARCAARKNGAPLERSPSVGFRCCADVRP